MRATVIGETALRFEDIGSDPAWLPEIARVPYDGRSLLVWGEHCTDCANPLCYMTCSLYAPRHDLKCRRFRDGLEKVRTTRGGIVNRDVLRAHFRKWGKLEASGSAAIVSAKVAHIIEWVDYWLSRVIGSKVLPYEIRRLGVKIWNNLKPNILAQFGKWGNRRRPDGFLVEAINHEPETVCFTLSIINCDQRNAKLDLSFKLLPGYNCIEFNYSECNSVVQLGNHMRVLIEPLGDVRPRISFLTIDFVKSTKEHCKAFSRLEPKITPVAEIAEVGLKEKVKCVVWDLDNTVWKGTLVEDGPGNIELNPTAVAAIVELDRRGIIQSVASKNSDELVKPVLRQFGLIDYFIFPQIRWGAKSVSMGLIRQSLNIGMDTFLFIDDQAFERNEVAFKYPDVETFDPADLASLLAHPRLNVIETFEGRNRRKMYVDEQKRAVAFTEIGSHYLDFLRSCNLKLRIDDLSGNNLDRVFELTERTNQLNYTSHKVSRQALVNMIERTDMTHGLVLSAEDKFGSYGIIGFCVIDTQSWRVSDFFMSCRVQRKKVDHAFFNWLRLGAKERNKGHLLISYRESARNRASVEVLEEEMRLARREGNDEVVWYEAPVDQPIAESDVVIIDDASCLRQYAKK